MARRLGARSWALRNTGSICEVCHKEPAWAFGWATSKQAAEPSPDPAYWPSPMSWAQVSAMSEAEISARDAKLRADTPKMGCRLVGDCTNNLDQYDVTFQAFMSEPQQWIDHVERKLWCDKENWRQAIERSGLITQGDPNALR